MKAVIVNCFETYENRVDLVHEFLMRDGYDVIVIQSDFMHLKKERRTEEKEGFVFVKTKPYYKNISATRLLSHSNYAREAFKLVGELKPDLLYTFVPPNFLAGAAAKYKRKNEKVKLVFDLIDLWPESMPLGAVKSFPPFTLWGDLRDRSLKYADLVITECDLFQSVLVDVLKGVNTRTVYLARKEIDVTSKLMLREDEIHLAYLGSINNVIDIPKIKEVIKAVNDVKPVTLHIIGDGEHRQELIDEAEAAGATVEYHGMVYDAQEKQDIFDRCHFGLNTMKDSTCVGLTMKSIDYFQHGLPIINNIPADTAEIVEKYGVGVNVLDYGVSELLTAIINSTDEVQKNYRENATNIYRTFFSNDSFFNMLKNSIR